MPAPPGPAAAIGKSCVTHSGAVAMHSYDGRLGRRRGNGTEASDHAPTREDHHALSRRCRRRRWRRGRSARRKRAHAESSGLYVGRGGRGTRRGDTAARFAGASACGRASGNGGRGAARAPLRPGAQSRSDRRAGRPSRRSGDHDGARAVFRWRGVFGGGVDGCGVRRSGAGVFDPSEDTGERGAAAGADRPHSGPGRRGAGPGEVAGSCASVVGAGAARGAVEPSRGRPRGARAASCRHPERRARG